MPIWITEPHIRHRVDTAKRTKWHKCFVLFPVTVERFKDGSKRRACFRFVERRSKLEHYGAHYWFVDEYRLPGGG